MNIAVVGDLGMFGREMLSVLKSKGVSAEGFNRNNLNLENDENLLAKKLHGYSVIINAVAYTSVDAAESNADLANHVNSELAIKLASVASITGAHLIQLSTDYVFDGEKATPYKTTDPSNARTAYGRSKATAEEHLLRHFNNFSIVRTSWLYGEYGECFPKTVKKLINTRGHMNVVNDQIGQPTWTRDLACVVSNLCNYDLKPKILHAVSSGQTTWFDFAKVIVSSIGVNPSDVLAPVTSDRYPSVALRPKWSVLETEADPSFQIGHWLERWNTAADRVLSQKDFLK